MINMNMITKMLVNSLISKQCKRSVIPFCAQLRHIHTQQNHNKSSIKQTTNTDNIANNPYYKKYFDKIEKIKQKLDQSINDNNDENNDVSYDALCKQSVVNNHSIDNASDNVTDNHVIREQNSCKTVYSSLGDIIKLDLLTHKTSEDIAQIWNNYHKTKDYCIYAVISDKNYDKIYSRSCLYPTFVYPIPRTNKSQNDGNAYEFILAQFSGHKCFFTPLIAYQTHKDNAPPCLTISHYPELQTDKGIVLMVGEYDSNILSAFEAQCLANQLQWYYGIDGTRQQLLLHSFNKQPKHFQYMDLIKELEEGMIGFSLDNNKNDNKS